MYIIITTSGTLYICEEYRKNSDRVLIPKGFIKLPNRRTVEVTNIHIVPQSVESISVWVDDSAPATTSSGPSTTILS